MRKDRILTSENTNAVSADVQKKTAVTIPDECKSELVKAMKIGYYKDFYKQGLITAEQLEILISMQNKSAA